MLFETIGFTGTQVGMTDSQVKTIARILERLLPAWVVHGDCIGADDELHEICIALRHEHYEYFKIRTRPCDIEAKGAKRGADEIMPIKRPLERNSDIVADSDLLLATPRFYEEELRSGTWATVRRARKANKPLIIVWPNGKVDWEKLSRSKQ